MTSNHDFSTVTNDHNGFTHEDTAEVTAFLLAAAERSPIVPIEGAIHDSERFPIFKLTTSQLCQGIRASDSAHVHLVGLALLRRRLEAGKKACQWN